MFTQNFTEHKLLCYALQHVIQTAQVGANQLEKENVILRAKLAFHGFHQAQPVPVSIVMLIAFMVGSCSTCAWLIHVYMAYI